MILENIVNKEYNKDVDERIVEFCKFLKMTTFEEMNEEYEGDEDYMAAIRRVEDLSKDPDFVGYYDIEEALEQDLIDAKLTGLHEGIEQGIEQGIKQRNIEIAKNMLINNININTISECTGLTIEEIEKLKF